MHLYTDEALAELQAQGEMPPFDSIAASDVESASLGRGCDVELLRDFGDCSVDWCEHAFARFADVVEIVASWTRCDRR